MSPTVWSDPLPSRDHNDGAVQDEGKDDTALAGLVPQKAIEMPSSQMQVWIQTMPRLLSLPRAIGKKTRRK